MEECCICQENIQAPQNSIILGNCSHKFHAICIQTWATIQNTCPLCREVFTEAQEINRVLPTLLAMAIIMPMEDQIQRISLSFAFIKLILHFFPTSAHFNTHKNLIIRFSENFQIQNYRLPLLSYSSRADFARQGDYLKTRFNSLLGQGGPSLERHIFVRGWKERLLSDPIANVFFYEKRLLTGAPHYYL
jgi:hypothetical protein